MKKIPRLFAIAGAALVLAGCATVAPDAAPPPSPAATWQTPFPHGGDAQVLADWWQRFDDPLLPALIADTQASNPTLAQALARLGEARAGLRSARAQAGPSLSGNALLQRASNANTGLVATTQASIGADASWELDLFGGLGHRVDAARARTEGAALGWHDARVSLAADVAQTYIDLRSCEALVAVYEQEAASQATSARLTGDKVRVGFEAPANGALADASAAQTRDRLRAQAADCAQLVKALVLLTGQAEPTLRERLAPQRSKLPRPAEFSLPALPAAVLAQRPDIAAAERELIAAAADAGWADAQRYPRITIGGSIALGFLRIGGQTEDAVSWGFGPQLVLPLFDGGARNAQRDAALARVDGARAALDLKLRQAVREVETALVRVDSATRREADAIAAAQGFRAYFDAAESRWKIGAGSLIEMEDARRVALAAQAGLIGVQRERVAAWVALYRAAGGGWSTADALPLPRTANTENR
jgi:multidrug efflux system outer membrane protein